MDPEQVRKRVQDAFVSAVRNTNMQRWHDGSRLDQLVRDVKLYGNEAALDFVETHLQAIVQSAVEHAECKSTSMTINVSNWGNAALASAAQALRDSTGLKVDVTSSTVTVIWAEPGLGLI